MEKGYPRDIAKSFQELDLNSNSNRTEKSAKNFSSTLYSSFLQIKKPKPPSLVSLCLGVVGKHLEDIIEDLPEIASTFPSHIRMAIAAIAKRRKLLNDETLVALAESSWEILDISTSNVSDLGLSHVVKTCKALRAVDISQCNKLTSDGVSVLLQHCKSLEVLRWGGCRASEHTARRCLSILRPNLHDVVGESWEELDAAEITVGAPSLRWLIWPKVDKDSEECLSAECPRIVLNPKASPFGYNSRGVEIPREALPNTSLDDPIVADIDPRTWAVRGFISRSTIPSDGPSELPIAERFRLAFLERETRLAPKRAKNARQHQRRAEKDRVMTSSRAKAFALASQVTKSLHHRS